MVDLTEQLRRYGNVYDRNLNAQKDFQSYDASHQGKFRLWDVINRVLEASKRSTRDDMDAKAFHEAVGITPATYNFTWTPQSPLSKTLGFKVVDQALDSTDLTDEELKNIKKHEIPDPAEVKKNAPYLAEANEFITFGRSIVATRIGVENAARNIVYFMKFDDAYLNYSSRRRKNQKIGYGGIPKTPPDILDAIAKKRYPYQVNLLADVFEGLSSSSLGRQFLAEMLAYRTHEGYIDPFNIMDPPERRGDLKIKGGPPYMSAVQGLKGVYFGANGALKLGSKATGISENQAKQNLEIAEAMSKIVVELNSGIAYMKSNPGEFGTTKEDADELWSKLYAWYLAKFYDDSDLVAMANEKIAELNAEGKTDEAKALEAKRDSYAGGLDAAGTGDPANSNWTWVNSTDQLAFSAGFIEKFRNAQHVTASVEATGKPVAPPDSARIGFLRIALAAHSFISASVAADGKVDSQGSLTQAQAQAYGLATMKCAADVTTGAEEAIKALVKDGYSTKGALRVAAKVAGPIALVLDCVFTVQAYQDAFMNLETDTDAALGMLVAAVSGTLVIAAEVALMFGVTAIAGAPVAGILLVGAIGGVIGAIMIDAFTDADLLKWIERCEFGVKFQEALEEPNPHEQAEFTNPEEPGYRYCKPGGRPDYARQVSGYYSLARKINLEDVRIWGDRTNDRVRLQFVLNPPTPQESGQAISTDGAVYLRPIFGGKEYPPMHKISLGDPAGTHSDVSKLASESVYLPTAIRELAGIQNKNQHIKGQITGYLQNFKEWDYDDFVDHYDATGMFIDKQTAHGQIERFACIIDLHENAAELAFGLNPDSRFDSTVGFDEDILLEAIYVPPWLQQSIDQNNLDVEAAAPITESMTVTRDFAFVGDGGRPMSPEDGS